MTVFNTISHALCTSLQWGQSDNGLSLTTQLTNTNPPIWDHTSPASSKASPAYVKEYIGQVYTSISCTPISPYAGPRPGGTTGCPISAHGQAHLCRDFSIGSGSHNGAFNNTFKERRKRNRQKIHQGLAANYFLGMWKPELRVQRRWAASSEEKFPPFLHSAGMMLEKLWKVKICWKRINS